MVDRVEHTRRFARTVAEEPLRSLRSDVDFHGCGAECGVRGESDGQNEGGKQCDSHSGVMIQGSAGFVLSTAKRGFISMTGEGLTGCGGWGNARSFLRFSKARS